MTPRDREDREVRSWQRTLLAFALAGMLWGFALGYLANGAMAATPNPYRTTHQAERYLTTQLPSWAGINLHPPANPPDEFGNARTLPRPSAYCLNGRWSAHERRTHRHYGSRTNRVGESTFRSFACDLYAYSDTDGDGQVTYSDDERTFHLYLQTRPGGRWYVGVDR